MADEPAAGARPEGDPRRPLAGVGPLGGAGRPLRRASSSAAGYGLAHHPDLRGRAVFRRGIGEESEVVGKEMYEFDDRGGRRLALRPEGTAPVVRAFVQHRPPLPWKAWYVTPAFRYERPRPGRYRQHHQVGVEALGTDDPDLDVEVIALADGVLPRRSACAASRCAVNSMGDAICRPAYLELLRGVPRSSTRDELCDEHRDRSRPTRCGSSTASGPSAGRRPRTRRGSSTTSATTAPPTSPGCARASRRSASRYRLDHRLVRGFDYYTRTTFEFAADGARVGPERDRRRRPLRRPRRDARRPADAGHRLRHRDRAGAARLRRRGRASPSTPPPLDAFVVDVTGGRAARDLTRRAPRRPGSRADRAFDGRSLKAQLKLADRSGARVSR